MKLLRQVSQVILNCLMPALVFVGCTNSHIDVTSLGRSPSSMGGPADSLSLVEDAFKGQVPITVRQAQKVTVPAGSVSAMNSSGLIKVVAFLDPQDAFSVRTYLALKSAASSNSNIQLSVRFKLNSTQGIARTKARYLYAAEKQTRFFDYADSVFGSSMLIKTESDLAKVANQIGLNSKKLAADASLAEMDTKLSSDESDLQALGSATAPAIFINDVRVYDFEVSTTDKVRATIAKIGG